MRRTRSVGVDRKGTLADLRVHRLHNPAPHSITTIGLRGNAKR
jgi:hypothetical protein